MSLQPEAVPPAAGLAAHLNLNVEERRAFADALAEWIGMNYSDNNAKTRLHEAVEAWVKSHG